MCRIFEIEETETKPNEKKSFDSERRNSIWKIGWWIPGFLGFLPFAFWVLLIEFEIELFDLLKTNRFSILKQKIYYDMI